MFIGKRTIGFALIGLGLFWLLSHLGGGHHGMFLFAFGLPALLGLVFKVALFLFFFRLIGMAMGWGPMGHRRMGMHPHPMWHQHHGCHRHHHAAPPPPPPSAESAPRERKPYTGDTQRLD